jgi:hypothetical protein
MYGWAEKLASGYRYTGVQREKNEAIGNFGKPA